MNEFDKLFNQYFGENENKNESSMDKIMKFLGQLNKGGLSGIGPMEAGLGEPDTVREFERDGVIFIESTWDTDQGTIVRIETKEEVEFTNDYFKRNNIPTGRRVVKEELTLEEQLEEAKKVEDYETCALIRDEIKVRDEEKIEKKDEVVKSSETIDDKGIEGDSEWNF